MARKHSWNRLLTKSTRVRPANPSAAGGARPPLAVLEQLEDRVLLSATSAAATTAATTEVLIGLLRGQIGLRTAELTAMKLAGELLPAVQAGAVQPLDDAFLKIERNFHRIERALFKLTENALSDQKVDKIDVAQKVRLENEIADSLQKVDLEVKLFGENGQVVLLPAVQSVAGAADGALRSLSDLGGVKLNDKLSAEFVKIEDDFLRIGGISDKWTSDVIMDKGNLDKFDQKLDSAFDKLDSALAAFGDGSVHFGVAEGLATLKIETLNFVDAFGSPVGVMLARRRWTAM